MIIEGILTTRNKDGSTNVAAMGPEVQLDEEGNIKTLRFKPFQTSQTYKNLSDFMIGVFHITDDVRMIAQTVIGMRDLELTKASYISTKRLKHCCYWIEFRVTSIDDSSQRAIIETQIVHRNDVRPFVGFNRAKHAILEMAILATRTHMLEENFIEQEIKRLKIPIQKTGSKAEFEALELLTDFIEKQYKTSNPKSELSKSDEFLRT